MKKLTKKKILEVLADTVTVALADSNKLDMEFQKDIIAMEEAIREHLKK